MSAWGARSFASIVKANLPPEPDAPSLVVLSESAATTNAATALTTATNSAAVSSSAETSTPSRRNTLPTTINNGTSRSSSRAPSPHHSPSSSSPPSPLPVPFPNSSSDTSFSSPPSDQSSSSSSSKGLPLSVVAATESEPPPVTIAASSFSDSSASPNTSSSTPMSRTKTKTKTVATSSFYKEEPRIVSFSSTQANAWAKPLKIDADVSGARERDCATTSTSSSAASMSKGIGIDVASGTDDATKRTLQYEQSREQGTSTDDRPWNAAAAPSRRDQSTSTEETAKTRGTMTGRRNRSSWVNLSDRLVALAATQTESQQSSAGVSVSVGTDGPHQHSTPPLSQQQPHYHHHHQHQPYSHGFFSASGFPASGIPTWNPRMGAMTGMPFPMGMGPPTTTNNHKWGSKEDNQQLSLELRQFGAYVSEVDEQSRPVIDHMITLLQEAVTQACPGAILESYGSYATGLWLPSSDVDMVVHLPKREPSVKQKNRSQSTGKKKEASTADTSDDFSSTCADATADTNAIKKDGHTPDDAFREAFVAFKNIAATLEKQPWTADVKPITSSKMPVIKLKVCHTPGRGTVYGIPFDITVDPGFPTVVEGHPDLAIHSGVPVKCMVKYCLKKMPGLQTLTLVLKQYLRECGLNDTYHGGVSSYTIFLMLVRYLQDHFPPLFSGKAFKGVAKKEEWARHICRLEAETDRAMLKSGGQGGEEKGTAITTISPSTSMASTTTSSSTSPSLHVNAPAFATTTRWRHLTSKLMKSTKRKPILGELLMEFLYLFGENFDYATMGFSILHGGRYFNVKEERHLGSPMWIDDPMRPGTNIAGSHFKITAVAGAFRDAFLMLNRHTPNPYYPTRLSRLIRANPWLQQFVYAATSRELLRIQSLHDSTQQIAANAHTHVLRDARPKMHTNQGTIPPPPKGYGTSRKKAAKDERSRKKNQRRFALKKKKKKGGSSLKKEAANSAAAGGDGSSSGKKGRGKGNHSSNNNSHKDEEARYNSASGFAGKNSKRPAATKSKPPQGDRDPPGKSTK